MPEPGLDSAALAGQEEAPAPTPLFEAAIVASMVVAVLCLFLFAWLGRQMLAGATRQFDENIRSWAHHLASDRMTAVMRVMSLLGYNILIAELAVAFLVFAKLRWKRAAVWLAIAMAGSLLLDLALKYAYHRARPMAFFGAEPSSYSFPSGHALCSFCFYGILAGLLSARIRLLAWRIVVWTAFAALVLAIGFSRIYLGVHYPSDVLAGYLAATVWIGTVIVLDHVHKVRRNRRNRT